jgi:hypothetical protein
LAVSGLAVDAGSAASGEAMNIAATAAKANGRPYII